jgi:hypothetical protein
MSEKPRRSALIYVIIAWAIVNILFFAYACVVDSLDLNNKIELVFWVISVIGLLSMRKLGAAFATFTITYAFSFNVFNLIYYFNYVLITNGISAIINALALVCMFKNIFENRFK